ncbi:MAG: hypothetical protein B6245_19015 [Desulfobacteraceae bacterium 4572_88]|nr:MAG: hypothetical protein B6245_19015 [Desulfobacteraceae bacterium 4572_88]
MIKYIYLIVSYTELPSVTRSLVKILVIGAKHLYDPIMDHYRYQAAGQRICTLGKRKTERDVRFFPAILHQQRKRKI